MTKKDIVRTIAEATGLPYKEARQLVQIVFDTLADTLVRWGRIELRNFGIFEIRQRSARVGRNPRTGERVAVAAKRIVVFKPGKEMDARTQVDIVPRCAGDSIVADHQTFEVDAHPIYGEMDAASEVDGDGDTE